MKRKIAVIGAGTMGAGIAQVAAWADHPVTLFDPIPGAIERAGKRLDKIHGRLVEKGRISSARADEILGRLRYCADWDLLGDAAVAIEAAPEDLQLKRDLFGRLEEALEGQAVLATNTSSLSVTSIASTCQHPWRVIGVHFFNPAPLMALVEIVPGLETAAPVIDDVRGLIGSWGKTTVVAQDTPGFIVNRLARPFYGESLRILEEGAADPATIDWALRELGGFRMGPFELMDLIGNDVNLAVTESVFEAFAYDPRYKPSLIQRRMVEAGRLGRKTGRGFYDYSPGAESPSAETDERLGQDILMRVLVMLINEAVDAVFLGVASPQDLDLAMTRGVNYPKGLLSWAEEIGLAEVLDRLENLHREYGEDRYRPSPLLRRLVRQGGSVFNRGPQ